MVAENGRKVALYAQPADNSRVVAAGKRTLLAGGVELMVDKGW